MPSEHSIILGAIVVVGAFFIYQVQRDIMSLETRMNDANFRLNYLVNKLNTMDADNQETQRRMTQFRDEFYQVIQSMRDRDRNPIWDMFSRLFDFITKPLVKNLLN